MEKKNESGFPLKEMEKLVDALFGTAGLDAFQDHPCTTPCVHYRHGGFTYREYDSGNTTISIPVHLCRLAVREIPEGLVQFGCYHFRQEAPAEKVVNDGKSDQ